MHFLLRDACRLSVSPSVHDIGGSRTHRLEILETTARSISSTPLLFVAQRPSTYSQGTWGYLGETGGVGKRVVLEHKSGNISETRKDRGIVTMEGLQEITNALSNGAIPPHGLLFPNIGRSKTHPKLKWYIHRVHRNKTLLKFFGEKGDTQSF